MGSITVSKKHGVNPSVLACYICGEDSGGLAMLGRLPGDAEAPRRMTLRDERCPSCTEKLKTKVALIRVKHGSEGEDPHRMGEVYFALDSEIVRIVTPDSLRDHFLKARICFVPEDAWTQLGLPVANDKGEFTEIEKTESTAVPAACDVCGSDTCIERNQCFGIDPRRT